jgi:hypothetical protein
MGFSDGLADGFEIVAVFSRAAVNFEGILGFWFEDVNISFRG